MWFQILGRDPILVLFGLAGRCGDQEGDAVGATDELGYNVIEDKVHVHDLQATILHLLGWITPADLQVPGTDFRLTDVSGEL
jgi:hypothetical protein